MATSIAECPKFFNSPHTQYMHLWSFFTFVFICDGHQRSGGGFRKNCEWRGSPCFKNASYNKWFCDNLLIFTFWHLGPGLTCRILQEYSRNYFINQGIFSQYAAVCYVFVPLLYGIFQEYSRNYFINQLLLMGRIFNEIFLCMQLLVMLLFHFVMRYSRKFLQVRPHP